jgi:hypothetical protein
MALLARWDSVPHFSHAKCLKADYKAAAETRFSCSLSRRWTRRCPFQSGCLDRVKAISPHRITKRNAYDLSYNRCALCNGIDERGSPFSSSPSSSRPSRPPRSLCRPARRVVRLVHAQPGRQRSRTFVQSRAIMGALRLRRGRSHRWRHRGVASPRRKNRWPGKWPVDREQRQRWSCGADASSLAGRRHCLQECVRRVLERSGYRFA